MADSTFSAKVYWQLWLVLLVLSVSWQDFFLVNQFGEIARNPIFLLSPAFILTEFLDAKRFKIKQFIKISNLYFYFIIGTLLVSVTYILFWYLSGKPAIILDEHIIVKTIKILTYYSLLWLFFRHVYFVLNKIGNPIKISTVFYLVCVIHFIILIVELYSIPNALPFFHSNDMPYHRVRLLTAESSFTGGVIVLLTATATTGTLFIQKKSKRNFRLSIIIAFVFLYVVATTSKMFFVTGIACTFIIITANFKLNYKYLLIALLFFIISFIVIYPKLEEAFIQDINNFTSTVTRAGSYLNGFVIASHHPLGTGGLYYFYFVEYVEDSVNFVTNVLGGGNTDEILQWGTQNDKNISTGAEFSLWLALLGLPGGILFILIYYKLIKYSKVYIFIYWGMLYFSITGFLTEVIMSKPNVFMFWAIVLYFYRLKNQKVHYEK